MENRQFNRSTQAKKKLDLERQTIIQENTESNFVAMALTIIQVFIVSPLINEVITNLSIQSDRIRGVPGFGCELLSFYQYTSPTFKI